MATYIEIVKNGSSPTFNNVTVNQTIVAPSVSGSLQGTASYAMNALSSSHANYADYVINSSSIDTGSFVTTASFAVFSSSYHTDSASFDARILAISGSGSSGGTTFYSSSFPSASSSVTVGGIDAGTPIGSLYGLPLSAIVDKMLLKQLFPTFTAPSFGTSVSPSALQEISASITITLTSTFNRGLISQSWGTSGFQDFRSGPATSYSFSNAQFGNIVTGSNVYSTSSFNVRQGNNTFNNAVSYSLGPQPIDNFGQNYSTPLASGSLTANSSFEGVYPLFATTSSITIVSKLALVSMISGQNVQINLAAESGGNKQTFWVPVAWTTSRPLTSVQYFNTVSGQFDTTNKITDFTTSADTQTVQGLSVNYTKYVYNGATRGALLIRLVF